MKKKEQMITLLDEETRCPRRCKGAMPEITPELIKALDIIIKYYKDFQGDIGCKRPSSQCFIYYINNVLWYKSVYKEN